MILNMRDNEIREEGRNEEKISSLHTLMSTMKWTAEEAMDALKIPSDDRQYFYAKL